jgi:hypothetical protein
MERHNPFRPSDKEFFTGLLGRERLSRHFHPRKKRTFEKRPEPAEFSFSTDVHNFSVIRFDLEAVCGIYDCEGAETETTARDAAPIGSRVIAGGNPFALKLPIGCRGMHCVFPERHPLFPASPSFSPRFMAY